MGKRKGSRGARRHRQQRAPAAPSASPEQQFARLVAAYQAGRYDEVVTGAKRFTQQWPAQVAGWNLLAEGQRMMEHLDDAEAACRQALSIAPKNAEAHNNTANVFRDRGETETAERAYKQALWLKPNLVEAHYNLGNLLLSEGRRLEAASAFRAAATGRPDEPLYHYALGAVLRKLEDYPQARMPLERAVQLRPEDVETHIELGIVYRELNEYDKAKAAFEQALTLRPEFPKPYSLLGNLLSITGDAEGAARCGRQILEIDRRYAGAWYLIANSRKFSEPDSEMREMEELLDSEDLNDKARSLLHFALGKAYSDAGSHPDVVFAHYRSGCDLTRKTFENYDIADSEQWMADIAEAFSSSWMAEHSGTGDPTEAPIFVIGMPRSGTTLTEQILSSHPRVHGAGECTDLKSLVLSKNYASGKTFPEWVPEMPSRELTLLGGHYRSQVIDPGAPAERVVDKMPSNFMYLGLIAKALPNAKVVHLQRDPVDTCLSCYMQRFTNGHPWSYDLEELGRFYRAYAKLMEHWRSVLPEGFILDFSYEELTANPEPQIRKLLDHCRLEWDPACLDFHKTQRAVRTASQNQVRRPMYRTSVAKWRKYRDHLQPLLDALGPLAPPDPD